MLNPPFKEGNAPFTTAPFKLLSFKKCERYRRFLVKVLKPETENYQLVQRTEQNKTVIF